MKLIQKEEASHWYDHEGKARHHVPYADKKRSGEMRPTKITDAKKNGWLPSVTNLLSVIAKPALTGWLQEQAILAALTLPRLPMEPLDSFAHRAIADSKKQTEEAARIGTALHDASEKYLQTKAIPQDLDIAILFAPVRQWLDENVEHVYLTERVLVNVSEGYAGTVDLIAKLRGYDGPSVIDMKSQKMKRNDDGTFEAKIYRDSWPLQLEAYRRAETTLHPVNLFSLVVNSQQASPPQLVPWKQEEHEDFWKAFKAARQIWMFQKNYNLVKNNQ